MCMKSVSIAFPLFAAVICAGCSRSAGPVPDETGGTVAEREAPRDGGRDISWMLRQHPEDSQLEDIDEDDPAHAALNGFVASIEQRYAHDLVSAVVIDYVKEVKGPASSQLFPSSRFFVCKVTEEAKASASDSVRYSCDTFIEAMALDKDLRLASIGPGTRHDKNFGEFLAENQVKITDEKSARLVWDAFCEIRRWRSKSDAIEKVSDRVWHLGVKNDRAEGRGKAYHEVRLDEDLTVVSMKHIIEDADGRRWD